MSNTPTQATPPTNEPVRQPRRRVIAARRRRNLTILTLVLIAAALALILIYLWVWQYREDTDDAYVAGHLVPITAQISASVLHVAVDDTQIVKANQLLVSLDDSDMQLAYERAQSELIQAIRQTQQQSATSAQAQAQVVAQKARLARAQSDLKRRESLQGTDAISSEEISHARADVFEAQAALDASEQQQKAANAAIGNNIPLRQQPAVLSAISHLKDAWLSLQRTQVRAPLGGQIAKRNVQIGQHIHAGTTLMVVVPLQQLWVDANFKESQLAHIRIGQPATVTADMYGSQVTYQGKVAGLSAGTGAAFSLLPAQNATGNWIKVVQRVPVRIELDAKQLAEHPLRIGLSMQVQVHTEDQSGPQLTAVAAKNTAIQANSTHWQPVEDIIDAIFAQYAR